MFDETLPQYHNPVDFYSRQIERQKKRRNSVKGNRPLYKFAHGSRKARKAKRRMQNRSRAINRG